MVAESCDLLTTTQFDKFGLFKMSAFSRGLFFRSQCFSAIHFVLPSTHISTRSFHTTSILRAAAKAASMKKALPRTVPKSKSTLPVSSAASLAASSPSAIYQTYASRLFQKPHPTLLYLAPSHTGFIISSYVMAGFCFTYATYFFWSNYLHPPETIETWVPFAFGGICFFMAGAGGYFVLGPAWIVKSLTAMPASALKAANVRNVGQELKIEVELRKMLPLPFFPARKIYVRPEEIRLKHVLASPAPQPTKLSASELRATRLQEEAEKAKALEYEQTHLLSRPFREIGRFTSKALFGLFQGVKRSWSREGFTGIYIKGYQYKLDVSGGWALDGGRALDRLVTIKLEA